MRLTALILGLFAGLTTLVHSYIWYVLYRIGQIELPANSGFFHGGLGLYSLETSLYSYWIVSVTVLMAASLVLHFPRASFFLFVFAAFFGFTLNGSDSISYSLPIGLTEWSQVYTICAVIAFFGQASERRWPINLIASWLRRQQEKQEHDVERS